MINGESKRVALLMYKTIMRLATLDGKATVAALRANLRELTLHAIKEDGNIDKIHTYFNHNFAQLKARGQSVDDVHIPYFLRPTFKVFQMLPSMNTSEDCKTTGWIKREIYEESKSKI
jgi:hypothetical protein